MSKMKYYRNNPLLKAVGVHIDYTEHQIREYIKCKQDPIYFIKNYIKIVNIDRGLVPFNMYDFQEEMVDIIHNNKKSVFLYARQMGKCLHDQTPISLRNKNYNSGQPFSIKIIDFYQWQYYIKWFNLNIKPLIQEYDDNIN